LLIEEAKIALATGQNIILDPFWGCVTESIGDEQGQPMRMVLFPEAKIFSYSPASLMFCRQGVQAPSLRK